MAKEKEGKKKKEINREKILEKIDKGEISEVEADKKYGI